MINKKDSYWFRHDSNAGRGLKMRKMAHIYSHWGKGIYWDVVEILRDQERYRFESDESSLKLLCDLIGCKAENRFLSWFKDCLKIGLFLEENGFFTCPPLSANMVRWEASKTNGSKGGRPKNKTKQKPKKNLANNLKKTIIEQKSIEEDIIEDEEDRFFRIDDLYNKYLTDDKLVSAFMSNKKNKIKNKDVLENRLKEFCNMLHETGVKQKSWNDFTSHFRSWNLKKPKEPDYNKSNGSVIGEIAF